MSNSTPTEVDSSLKELSMHGSYELPLETYCGNFSIFRSLYLHWHDEMEIIYIEKGAGILRLNKETFRIQQGDLILINRGVLHSINTDKNNIISFRSIVFDISFLSAPTGDLCQEHLIAPLLNGLVDIIPLIKPSDSDYRLILSLFESLFLCHSQKKQFYYVELKALFYRLFYLFLANKYLIPAQQTDSEKGLSSIKAILNYINSHYQENISAGELAQMSHYSQYYFMKLFHQYTGKTLITYINDLRIEKSQSLLLHSNASITDIALDVGFNNTSYFIKKFQEVHGISPKKYRKNNL